jgi:ribosomal protein S18 acetylase RimI-like enzyme
VSEILNHARDNGYDVMLLDTIRPLKAAINLYKKHGFEECEPYYDNPMDDVVYMKRDL